MTDSRRGKQSIEAALDDVFSMMRGVENCIDVFGDRPEVLVDEVIARLKELSGASVQNLDGVPERVTFPLPKELQDPH